MNEFYLNIIKEISLRYWSVFSIYCKHRKSKEWCSHIRFGVSKKTCEFDNCPFWPKD